MMTGQRTIDNGYIKLFRKFFDSELWKEKRVYSKAEAWIDLIEMARWGYEPVTLMDKRGSYVLEFGDIYVSVRYLGERWQWSKNKARHFMEYLEKRGSISVKKRDSHRTIINLTNLGTYLGWEFNKRDSEGTVKGQSRDSEGTKKKPLKPLEPKNNIVEEVIDHLNLICGKKYKASSDANKIIINARANEGFTVEDLKYVIEVKARQWKGDKKNDKYLRPETLFGKTKFESYLNESMPEKEVYATMAGEDGMLLEFYSKKELEAYKIEKGFT